MWGAALSFMHQILKKKKWRQTQILSSTEKPERNTICRQGFQESQKLLREMNMIGGEAPQNWEVHSLLQLNRLYINATLVLGQGRQRIKQEVHTLCDHQFHVWESVPSMCSHAYTEIYLQE